MAEAVELRALEDFAQSRRSAGGAHEDLGQTISKEEGKVIAEGRGEAAGPWKP